MEWRWYGAIIVIIITGGIVVVVFAVALAMGVASPSSLSAPCWGEGIVIVVVCCAGVKASLLSAMLGWRHRCCRCLPCWAGGIIVVVVCHAGLEASLSLLSAMLG